MDPKDLSKEDDPLAQFGRALRRHEAEILADSLECFRRLPHDRYNQLMLQTNEGRLRMAHWTHLAVSAFLGDLTPFFQDMSAYGYLRAKQGYTFNDLIKVQQCYIHGVAALLARRPEAYAFDHQILLSGVKRLMDIAYETVTHTADSFITTREEIIADKVRKLQGIYLFTQKIMTTFSRDQILSLTIAEITNLYGLENCHLALCHPEMTDGGDDWCTRKLPERWRTMAEKVWQEDCEIYLSAAGEALPRVDGCGQKLAVVAPIRGFEKRYGSLVINDGDRPFRFGEEERHLLFQFLFLTAMMLENSLMVAQLEQHGNRLGMLTRRTLEVSEQERKKLSEDIHDTLTQTLTGISYKLQFCQEIAGSDPALLQKELNELVSTVQVAIKQSRDIISSLHPDIVDNIGLVSALENSFSTYTRKTGIRVEFSWPEDVEFPARITKGLYRIVNEALANVHKHSQASLVSVNIMEKAGWLRTTIQDNGPEKPQKPEKLIAPEHGKFGLFYMQQTVESLRGALRVERPPEGGLKISAIVPLEEE